MNNFKIIISNRLDTYQAYIQITSYKINSKLKTAKTLIKINNKKPSNQGLKILVLKMKWKIMI